LKLRREYADLGNCSPFRVYSAKEGSRLFAYKRGEMLLAVNPGLETLNLALDGEYTPVYTFGTATVEDKTAALGAQSFLVLKPNV
jgi:maltose alpha-D-glucosyltransferase/alpha-amylase